MVLVLALLVFVRANCTVYSVRGAPVFITIALRMPQPRFKNNRYAGVILRLRIPGTVPAGYSEYPHPLSGQGF